MFTTLQEFLFSWAVSCQFLINKNIQCLRVQKVGRGGGGGRGSLARYIDTDTILFYENSLK